MPYVVKAYTATPPTIQYPFLRPSSVLLFLTGPLLGRDAVGLLETFLDANEVIVGHVCRYRARMSRSGLLRRQVGMKMGVSMVNPVRDTAVAPGLWINAGTRRRSTQGLHLVWLT